MKKKITTYTVSSLLQKTYIILAVLAFAVMAAGMIYSVIHFSQSTMFTATLLPMLTGVILPVLVFVVAYLLFEKSASRRWRVFKAMTLATIAIVIQQVLLMVFYFFAQSPQYEAEAASLYMPLGELIPAVVAVLAAAGVAMYIKEQNKTVDQASPRLQAIYVGAIAIPYFLFSGLTVWQSLIPTSYGSMDILSLIASILIPALVPAALFLIVFFTAKKATPVWSKVFLGTVYVTLAVFVSVIFGSGLTFISQLFPALVSMDVAMNSSMIAAAVVFIGIILWHKKAHAF
jgi:hypothetical protein